MDFSPVSNEKSPKIHSSSIHPVLKKNQNSKVFALLILYALFSLLLAFSFSNLHFSSLTKVFSFIILSLSNIHLVIAAVFNSCLLILSLILKRSFYPRLDIRLLFSSLTGKENNLLD